MNVMFRVRMLFFPKQGYYIGAILILYAEAWAIFNLGQYTSPFLVFKVDLFNIISQSRVAPEATHGFKSGCHCPSSVRKTRVNGNSVLLPS